MGSTEETFAYAMQLVTSSSLAMVLVNTVKLKAFEVIAEAGPGAHLSAHEIVSRLSITNTDAPDKLDRMLRLLASYSIVTCTQGDYKSRPVRAYGLTPVAKYFTPNEDGASLGVWMELETDKVFHDSWYKLKDSVVEGGVPFDMAHGKSSFAYCASDARFSELFNNAMVNHTTTVMKKILECYHGFDNLKSLVDVGGGLGITLNMIVSKHPTIKGICFDQPHVTRHGPPYPGIEHVGGDMFQEVPQGDAMFMKWVLHDWSDEHCTKLLKNCYKALPQNGKVIVVDEVLPFLPDTSTPVKAITQHDALLMTHNHGGKMRTEDEWLALAKSAGFKGITKACSAFHLWVMEFYK